MSNRELEKTLSGKDTQLERQDDMAAIVGSNLKRIRLTRKLSLDEVSEMCSVSKSMLSGIERGIKSPTITVLYKICKGIHISLNTLIEKPVANIEVVQVPVPKKVGTMDSYVIFEYDVHSSMEISIAHIAPRTTHATGSHGENVWEYVTVLEGEFTLWLKKQPYRLKQGESLRFQANCQHVYANETDEDLWIHSIMKYDDI